MMHVADRRRGLNDRRMRVDFQDVNSSFYQCASCGPAYVMPHITMHSADSDVARWPSVRPDNYKHLSQNEAFPLKFIRRYV